MKAATVFGWLKNRPRYSLTILFAVASGYAIDRWFFSGVMASKWIGLPQYASENYILINADQPVIGLRFTRQNSLPHNSAAIRGVSLFPAL
jgi:hypothetical protein